jgi:hypothetical protein
MILRLAKIEIPDPYKDDEILKERLNSIHLNHIFEFDTEENRNKYRNHIISTITTYISEKRLNKIKQIECSDTLDQNTNYQTL